MEPEQTAPIETPAVCISVLQELIEDGWIGLDEQFAAVRALLIDFHGHGVVEHSFLRRLALSKVVNRSLIDDRSLLRVRPSYHGIAKHYVMQITDNLADGD